MTRKTTRVATLRPYAKIVLGEGDEVSVEDNFPDTYEGRSMLASVLYGCFQAVANDASRMAPKIEIPNPETVSKLALPRG